MSKVNVKVVYKHAGNPNSGGGDLHVTEVKMDAHDWNFKGHVEQAVADQVGDSYFNITATRWGRA